MKTAKISRLFVEHSVILDLESNNFLGLQTKFCS